MKEDDGSAAIEFVESRRVSRIAGPFITVTRQKDDSIGFERIQRVLDLSQVGTVPITVHTGNMGDTFGAKGFLLISKKLRGR